MKAYELVRVVVNKTVVSKETGRRGNPGYPELQAIRLLVYARIKRIGSDKGLIRHLKKNRKSDATIETYTKLLRTLDKHGDLYDPESVKSVIAFHYKSKVTKRLAVCAYSSYLNFVGGQWKKPIFIAFTYFI